MDYETIYSISYLNMPVVIYATSIISLVIIVLIISKKELFTSPKVMRSAIITAIFAGLFGFGSAYSHLSNAYSLENGDCKLVEGKVENFSPASANPKGTESFEVSGKTFSYSDTQMSGGLTHSISSSIKGGSIVKVYYKNDAILRLEVKR